MRQYRRWSFQNVMKAALCCFPSSAKVHLYDCDDQSLDEAAASPQKATSKVFVETLKVLKYMSIVESVLFRVLFRIE